MNSGTRQKLDNFRRICAEKGLAFTHQRSVIYMAITGSMEHPTPEAVYRKVKRRIPSVSLATVYKNIHTFLEAGLLREIASKAKAIVFPELNMGQMVLEAERAVAGKIPVISVPHAGGTVHDPDVIVENIMEVAR